jgi:hypothetical protein
VFWIAGKRVLTTWDYLVRVVRQWDEIERTLRESGPGPWFIGINEACMNEMLI